MRPDVGVGTGRGATLSVGFHTPGGVLVTTLERIEGTIEAPAPIPLHRLDGSAAIMTQPLARGTAALVVRAYGRVTICVAESIPRREHAQLAAHVFELHRRACRAASCRVARGLLPSLALDLRCTGASA